MDKKEMKQIKRLKKFVSGRRGSTKPSEPSPAPPLPSPGLLGRTLEKYINRGLHPFIRIDGFNTVDGDRGRLPDREGDSIEYGPTWDMMSGGPMVRLLIRPGIDAATVCRLLKKVRAFLKEQPNVLTWAIYPTDDQPF